MQSPYVLFTRILLKWYKKNTRDFPWIGEKDPYRVWLSEVILQQTRVEQGLPYYEKMIQQYPAVCDLARADDRAVFRLWQGLGYYNRCKNMLATARKICDTGHGRFPDTYEGLLQLPGIGEYTAAAVSSFAFGLPYAVVDGNAERVLARYFGIREAVNSAAGKKYFKSLADKVLHKKNPATFNQAIMDFGATVCTPRQPGCAQCPFHLHCYAYQHQAVDTLPLKQPKKKPIVRFIHYFVIQHGGQVYLHKRTGKDIWQNLHEFLFYEKKKLLTEKELKKSGLYQSLLQNNQLDELKFSGTFRHQLTHQTLHIRFIRVRVRHAPVLPEGDYFAVKPDQLDHYAFPRVIVRYLEGEKWINKKKS